MQNPNEPLQPYEHDKPKQLGYSMFTTPGVPQDPRGLDLDRVWAEATTVEEFKADIEEIAKLKESGQW